MTDPLHLTRPDDWHLHLRDGAMLKTVVAHSARQFGRAMIMPNLVPPATSCARVLEYRQRILTALPAGSDFNPIMALYLTDQLNEAEIRQPPHRRSKTLPGGGHHQL